MANEKQTIHPDILLAEDGAADAKLVQTILAHANPALKIEWVADGEAALERLFTQQMRPRLILLDIMMPGMDGLELLYRIKSHSGTHDIPVVMLTSLETENAIVSSYKMGVTAYVTKPIHRAALLDALAAAGCDWMIPEHSEHKEPE